MRFNLGREFDLTHVYYLLGMLLSGLMLRCISVFTTDYAVFMDAPPSNHSYIPVDGSNPTLISDSVLTFAATLHVNKELSSALRQIALATILTRAGLGLEPKVLRQIWTSMIRLTCMPCLTEACCATIVSKFLMNWPWPWAAMMG